MRDGWILSDTIFDGAQLLSETAILLVDGKVADVAAERDLPKNVTCRRVNGTISPGFLDLQVNGGGGILLNADPTASGIAAIALAHRKFGTRAIMPTVITDRPEVLKLAEVAAIAARDSPHFLGLHIEGPHIHSAKRGTHALHYIRPLDETTMAVVSNLRANGVRVLITLAPEAATLDQIGQLVQLGATVSLGHSGADSNEAHKAFAAGAQGVTHLFNAMSPMTSREPGLVGAALNAGVYAGIICDGFHVADEMIALAYRAAKRPDRMYLVSDAMPTVGGGDSFNLYGAEIRLNDGRLINAEGNLAGAHTTQSHSVFGLVHRVGLSLEAALLMSVTTPAKLIAAETESDIRGRRVEDLILLDQNAAFQGYLCSLDEGAIAQQSA